MDDLEPNIRRWSMPSMRRVLSQTFSSCEGHYEPIDQIMVDRNHAYVRFVPAASVSAEQVEEALGGWLVAYKKSMDSCPCA